MNRQLKNFLIDWLPPAMLRILTGFFYGWKGNYPSWNAAVKASKGYDAPEILDKVKTAALKVKSGEAAFERDSVLFFQPDYSFPLLSSLLSVALEQKRLHVLDYGGSLGSLYFQHKNFFCPVSMFQWHIIEQRHFVETGKKYFANHQLFFHQSVKECMLHYPMDVALFGSSLQYLEDPFQVLDEIVKSGIAYLVIDRTPLMITQPSRITVQRVHPSIYKASYPCRLLNKTELLLHLQPHFSLVSQWQHHDRINIRDAAFCGFFLKRK